jgi:hypothetical protein
MAGEREMGGERQSRGDEWVGIKNMIVYDMWTPHAGSWDRE